MMPVLESNQKYTCIECKHEFLEPFNVPVHDDGTGKLVPVPGCPKCFSASVLIVKARQGERHRLQKTSN